MCVQFALYEHLTIYEYHITCVHIQVKIKGDTNVNSTQHTQTDWRKRFDDVIVSYLYLYTVCRHVNFFLYKKKLILMFTSSFRAPFYFVPVLFSIHSHFTDSFNLSVNQVHRQKCVNAT